MNADFLRLNRLKFDLIFGSVLLLGSPLLITRFDMEKHPLLTGVLGLFIYGIEVWAFTYKVTAVRVRALQASIGRQWMFEGQLPKLPTLVIIGRGLRALIRASVFIVSIRALNDCFHWWEPNAEPNILYGYFLIFVAEGMFWNMVRLGNPTNKPREKEKERDDEYTWRRKHSDFLDRPCQQLKEIIADYILLIIAIMFTNSYWHYIIEFYQQRAAVVELENPNGQHPMSGVLFGTVISAAILMLPSRLHHWAEEAWNSHKRKQRLRLVGSLFFAYASVLAPVMYKVLSLYKGKS